MSVNLKTVPLFKGLPEDELRILADKAVIKTLPKNALLFTEGESSQSLYVVLSGKVKVCLNDQGGKEIILDVKGPGEYVGKMALDDGPRPASIITMEPSLLAVISGSDFKQLLIKHSDLAFSVIVSLIQEARALIDNVKSYATLDVYGRVSRMLLALAVENRGNLVIPEKMTQQDMAGRVGTSREVINRILRDLTIGGYIDVKDRTITINKPLPARW